MKIAFVYDAVYPFVTGGAEKRVYELAKRLAQKGHDVHWYGIGWWWPQEGRRDIELKGIKLHGVCEPIDLYSKERRSIKEAILFSIKLFPRLMEERYDVIDCQGFPFFSCFTSKVHSLLGKSTLIITLHEVWNDYWYKYIGKAGFFGKSIEKIMVYLSNNLITVSKKTKKDLKGIKPSEKSIIIPNGIDFNHINNIIPSNEKSDVIFAGRLIKEKNIDILIKSIYLAKDKIPNIQCLIIGDGPERLKLEKLVHELNLSNNVIFKGFMENYDDLISYMKSSKVFVLPSTREGFGIVVIEANASGLPVIVVKHKMNAACDLIEDNINGFISEFSEESISDKIINSINADRKMHNNCIKTAKKYDWNMIINKIEKYYESVNNNS
ncbi:glycosyltransferase family 4 protein [Methanobacterium sp. ACI-7]|uniref:glycosyltransferase family 4 protein n=1 Tax=unclassified Methanobacterium TaxID=2627676 RepID=UPI0039C33A82